MLMTCGAADPMTAPSFGASGAVHGMQPWGCVGKLAPVAGYVDARPNATTIFGGRPTSSPDRWTG